MRKDSSLRAIFILSLLVSALLCLAISNQSLWIDEGKAVWLASQRSIGDLFTTLDSLNTSDPQMPLYLVYLWVWIRLFGASEIALRASNIPFAVLLSVAFSWALVRLFRRRSLWLLPSLSPFLWFYMNEARPYIPVIACAAVSVVAAKAYFADRQRFGRNAPWICIGSLLILCASYMLGTVLGVAIVVFVALEARRTRIQRHLLLREWRLPIITQLPFFLLLGLYFLSTLLRGSGGNRGIPGPGNLAFAAYEFLGFSGLGPPRNDLRADPHLSTLLPYWPWLLIGGLACSGLVVVTMVAFRSREQRSEIAVLMASFGISGALMAIASLATGFQVWGRHWAPLFPFFLLSVLLLFSAQVSSPRSRTALTVTFALVLAAWAISDVRLRFVPSYYKDDYRLAADIALSEYRSIGATIVWVADESTAQYYGLQAEQTPTPTSWPARAPCLFATNWPEKKVNNLLRGRVAPLVLVFSKPDLYDRTGAWKAAVREFHASKIATPNAFDVYLFDQRQRIGSQ